MALDLEFPNKALKIDPSYFFKLFLATTVLSTIGIATAVAIEQKLSRSRSEKQNKI